MKSDQPGLSYFVLGEEQAQGFEPALANDLLASGLRYKMSQKFITSEDWETAFRDGAVMAFSSISFDASRFQKYIFAGPYLQTPLGALARKGRNLTESEITSLHALRVCYIRDTTAEAIIDRKAGIDNTIQTLPEDRDETCLQALDDQSADLFVSDAAILIGWQYSNQARGKYVYYSESQMPDSEMQQYGIAMLPSERNLCLKLDDELHAELTGPSETQWIENFREYIENGAASMTEQDIQNFMPSDVNRAWCTSDSTQG